ncbi:MAG: 3-hydroxybutyryl-CoA dehydrogenase [Chloroflexi bacterium]|nr:3-hydroxybutyryl-CoA dehydrogenase [Chloroflexota bacterium]
MEIKKVGVVGCGAMGSGITQVSAQAGYQVTVREISDEFLNRGLGGIRSGLERQVERGRMTAADKDATLGRIKGTTRLDDLAESDLVIEAAVEEIEPKRAIFGALDKLCPPTAILATNTSSLTVIQMAAATKRPEMVLGLHFFNPVPVMKLVEIVKTIVTSDEVVETGRKFVESVGKTPVFAKDQPGFISNRLLAPYLIDAIRVYEAGLGTAEDIDQTMVLGCNHPMGPLTLADFIGLDVLMHIAESLHAELAEPRFAPPPLLKRMVMAGHLGRKTKRGFYTY